MVHIGGEGDRWPVCAYSMYIILTDCTYSLGIFLTDEDRKTWGRKFYMNHTRGHIKELYLSLAKRVLLFEHLMLDVLLWVCRGYVCPLQGLSFSDDVNFHGSRDVLNPCSQGPLIYQVMDLIRHSPLLSYRSDT
jgi:hypothetical protein